MPAPEYPRTQDLRPTLLGELKGGLGFASVFETLADKLHAYVNARADRLNARLQRDAEQSRQQTPIEHSRASSPRGRFGPVHDAHERAVTRENLQRQLRELARRRPQ